MSQTGCVLAMTDKEREIEKQIRVQLGELAAHVIELYVLDMSITGDSFFAEVILDDGNKIVEAKQAILPLTSFLKERGTRLDARVAAKWTLNSVEYTGVCYGESGGIRTADNYKAELMAGTAHQTVNVEVSHGALWELQERFKNEPDQIERVNKTVCDILKNQLNEWLRLGGESRWNPVEHNVVQLNRLPLMRAAS